MTALSLDSRVRIAGDVIYREVDAEAIVLNLETGIYFGLDDVGSRMWHLIAELGSLREVRRRLLDEFDVGSDTLDRDLLAFAADLTTRGLLVEA